MGKLVLGCGLLASAAAASGCANVSVAKVPVAQRAANQDNHVEGFRYYLTRPYILVKKAVDVGSEAVAVKLVHTKTAERGKKPGDLVLVTVTSLPGKDDHRFFDLDGKELGVLKKGGWEATSPVKTKPMEKPPNQQGEVASVPANLGSTAQPLGPNIPNITAPPLKGSPNATGAQLQKGDGTFDSNFEVVHLPDFEEQYAIKSVNVAAKSKYGYSFADGSKLDLASGNYNSTEVPVAFLNTISKLIGAATEVRAKALKELLPTGPGGAKAEISADSLFYIRTTQFIEPGLYRIQKSWERHAAEADTPLAPDRCLGLLTEFGFSIGETRSVLTEAEFVALTPPSGAAAGGQ